MVSSGNSNKFKLKSKFFNYHSTPREQSLVNSLIKEAIHINGLDMIYIPRVAVALDKIYGEDVLSSFLKTFEMVMYVESSESFGGNNSFLGGFGLELNERVTFILSRDVFTEVVSNSPENDTGLTMPNEGDLIYSPTMNKVFEIMDIEEYQLFYQLGKQYTYKLTCELWDYSNETVSTGLPEIDNKNKNDILQSYEIILKTTPVTPYQIGEQVYIGFNLAVADFVGTVITYDAATRKLGIDSTSGTPSINVNLVGDDSTATAEIKSVVTVKFHNTNKDNAELQTEAAAITVLDPKDDDFGY